MTVLVPELCVCMLCPSQALTSYKTGFGISSLGPACYLLHSRQQLNSCSLNDCFPCSGCLLFAFFFFFPKTDFKFFKISGDKVITNETLQFSNLSGLKIILRTCFKCTVPGLKYTGFFCLFVFCTFTKLYNHHHYLIPGHFYPPKKKRIFISSHSPCTPIPQPLAITAF